MATDMGVGDGDRLAAQRAATDVARLRDELSRVRLAEAREDTRHADGKAGQLLQAVGLLLTAAGLVTAVHTPRMTGLVLVLAGACGGCLTVALVVLLWVLKPRLGATRDHFHDRDVHTRTVEVEAIGRRKYRLISTAVYALATGVLAAVAAMWAGVT